MRAQRVRYDYGTDATVLLGDIRSSREMGDFHSMAMLASQRFEGAQCVVFIFWSVYHSSCMSPLTSPCTGAYDVHNRGQSRAHEYPVIYPAQSRFPFGWIGVLVSACGIREYGIAYLAI